MAWLGLASVVANAACTNVTNQIPYTTIQPNEAVVGWGPTTVGNAGCYAMVDATVTPDGNVYAPSLFIQKMVGGSWQTVSSSTWSTVSTSGSETAGQFRLLIQNVRYPGPISVRGTVKRNVP